MKKTIFLVLLFSSVLVFAQVVVSPNMNLPVPIPGVTTGPDWASDINSSLTLIDSHNHSAGQGVQINPNGININADFPMNNNNITTIKTARFFSQPSPITSTAPNVGAVYVSGNELYYNDYTGGHQVQITNGGSVNAGAGSITGLPSGTASVAYSGGTYVFQSATNTAANIDGESFILRNSAANSKGLTLSPPAAMGADYGLVLPNLPAQTNVMTLDTSGNMGSITYDAVGTNMTATGANAIQNTQTVFPTTHWASYTPTVTGMTYSALAFRWRLIGENIEVMGQVTVTSTSGVTFSITLPNSYIVASTIAQTTPALPQVVGSLIRNVIGAPVYFITASPSQSVVFGGVSSSGSNPEVALIGNDIGTNSFSVNFSIPVQ